MNKKNIPLIFLTSLIALLVPLYLYVNNYSDTPFLTFVRTVLVSLVLYFLFFLVSLAITRNALKASLLACSGYFLFSIYGVIYSLFQISGGLLSHHKVLAPVFIVIFAICLFFVLRNKQPSQPLLAVSVIVSVFVVIQLFQLAGQIVTVRREADTRSSKTADFNRGVQLFTANPGVDKPDVYYIILDMYSREDYLKDEFDFDNSSFISSLRNLGFYVADCSRSNYVFTEASLASSLNMIYLQDASNTFTPENTSKSVMDDMILNSTVFEQFKALGYKTISFETGYGFTDIKNADEFLSPGNSNYLLAHIQPFEIIALQDTAIRILFDTHLPLINSAFDKFVFPYYDHVTRQHFMLDTLPNIARETEPTFTFAHITIPHMPFVFLPDGEVTTDRRFYTGGSQEPVSEALFDEGYTNQVQYINSAILKTVKAILANSSEPPIIIIQGDHGVKTDNRFPILNAYYFPGQAKNALSSTVTPVNSFRILFDNYFGAAYPLLENKNYFSPYTYPYNWQLVTADTGQCVNADAH